MNKACNSLSGVTIGNYFTPLIPKLRDEVQNLNTLYLKIVWIHGSEVVCLLDRSEENEDYLRRCQEKHIKI